MKKIIKKILTLSVSAAVALSSAAVPQHIWADTPEVQEEKASGDIQKTENEAALSEEMANLSAEEPEKETKETADLSAEEPEKETKETEDLSVEEPEKETEETDGTDPEENGEAEQEEARETEQDSGPDRRGKEEDAPGTGGEEEGSGPEKIKEEGTEPGNGEEAPETVPESPEEEQKTLFANLNLLTADNTSVSGIKNKKYTGDPITQNIKVYYTGPSGKVLLQEGADYTTGYQNNTDAGTAVMTVTGTGAYYGTMVYYFTINPVAIKEMQIRYPELSFTGEPRTQSGSLVVKAVVGGKEKILTRGTDFKVSYQNNVNIGTASIYASGVGNYKGELKGNYEITQARIASAQLKHSSLKYNGKKRTQTSGIIVKAKLYGAMKTLKLNEDYTVSYKNNIKIGTATAIIKGKGKFGGTIRKTFEIVPSGTSITKLTIGHRTITAEWAYKKKNVTGYELQYSRKPDFSSAKTVRFDNNATVQKKIKKLTAGKTYYFRVRTYLDKDGKSYYSPWSAVRNRTITYCDMTISGSNGWRNIKVINPPADIGSMQAAVWTGGGAQDDLKWIGLTRNSDGTWGTSFSVIDMNRSGETFVHLYSGSTFLNASAFSIRSDENFTGLYLKGDDSKIDFVQCAINIARDDNIGYGHTWPNTISCSGLVGLTLTYCGYADFIQNDPLGWGYIGIGNSFEKNLMNVLGCKRIKGKFNSSNYKLLKAGDILLYDNELGCHVGIYMGNGYTVEARGPEGAGPTDENGFEVGVYDWRYDRIEFDTAFRIPKGKMHYRW